ncbi:MAG: nucleotide sugar dehydrogenase [Deltaproteobacteria bacterium]|nr:nucleotide sugar dehydrogenase [Deltaproteobacteria bacterium]
MAEKRKIGVIGLGYVGLPLAVAFGDCFPVVGYDRDRRRVNDLLEGRDRTNEITTEKLTQSKITFTSDPNDLATVNFFVVTVPTPIDDAKRPDLSCLVSASETVGARLKKGDIVVYESTVYPGVTEEECIPVLERTSGLKAGSDFFVGYSPERVNPGDKERTLTRVLKIISAQNEETLAVMNAVYGQVIKAGLYQAPSIKVAEAAKVIENIQRDLNIALMNEIAVICHRLGIDTAEVLRAAGTKWNFLSFSPGLVGGHCIGVDPYYLTHKAEILGYHPQVILSGRRINDSMGIYIVQQAVKKMIQNNHSVNGHRALVLGLTFKEDVPDLRNSRVPEMIKELQSFGLEVDVYDPLADPEEAFEHYGVRLEQNLDKKKGYALFLVAVAHKPFKGMKASVIKQMAASQAVVVDVKNLFSKEDFVGTGLNYWRI